MAGAAADGAAVRLVICVPFRGYIEPETEDMLRIVERGGFEVVRRQLGTVDLARSTMATELLEQEPVGQGPDALLWIDSDMMFVPSDIDALLHVAGAMGAFREHEPAIIAGLYARRNGVGVAAEGAGEQGWMKTRDLRGVELEISRATFVGGGFTLVPALVYARVRSQFHREFSVREYQDDKPATVRPYYLPAMISQSYHGEDYAFCHRATRGGCRVYVAAGAALDIGHIGRKCYVVDAPAPERPTEAGPLP